MQWRSRAQQLQQDQEALASAWQQAAMGLSCWQALLSTWLQVGAASHWKLLHRAAHQDYAWQCKLLD